jgi:hypothetical protein
VPHCIEGSSARSSVAACTSETSIYKANIRANTRPALSPPPSPFTVHKKMGKIKKEAEVGFHQFRG